MKHLILARLGIALAIPLVMVGCEAPESNDANSEQAIHAKDDDAGGGWCPMSALATCQATCELVADCAFPPLFPEVDAQACAFSCASGLMDNTPEVERVISCLSEVVSEHSCCEITGCAAAWLTPAGREPTPIQATPGPDEELEIPGADEAPLAVALDSSACPMGARFATNGQGLGFCLFEDVVLPGPHLAEPYCHFVWDDYLGFSWPEIHTPPDYLCPEETRASSNLAGTSFCLYEDLNVPNTPSLTPYCHFLEDGVLGYSWCLDPLAPGCGDTSRVHRDEILVTPVPHDEVAPAQAPVPAVTPTTPTGGDEETSDPATHEDTDEIEAANEDAPEVMTAAPFASEDGDMEEPFQDEDEDIEEPFQDEDEDIEEPVDVEDEEDDVASPGPKDEPSPETSDGTETNQPMGDGAPEELDQDEEDLPEPVSAEAPEDDEEDLRCQSMCERIDFCGGLEGSGVDVVSDCVSLCYTWGGGFTNALFYCNLDSAETCGEVLACWTPGGPGH